MINTDKIRSYSERLINYTAIYVLYLGFIAMLYLIVNTFYKVPFLAFIIFSFFLSFFLQPLFNKINLGKPIVEKYLKFLDSLIK